MKTMMTKLEIIISSIWIELWNWKPLKLLQKSQGKKLEIQRLRMTLKNIIFGKLGLNDEIKNKLYKRTKTKN
jgi:hypothetical protein